MTSSVDIDKMSLFPVDIELVLCTFYCIVLECCIGPMLYIFHVDIIFRQTNEFAKKYFAHQQYVPKDFYRCKNRNFFREI